jgi:hypothetical protein
VCVRDEDPIGGLFHQCPVARLAPSQLLLGLLRLGDVLVGAEDADHFALLIAKRHLGRPHPERRPVVPDLWLLVVHLGPVLGDDDPVVLAVQARRVLPGEVEVILADDLLR